MWEKKNHETYEAIKEKAKEKKVTWNKNLLEIKNISPRVKKESFKFPSSPEWGNGNTMFVQTLRDNNDEK